MQRILLAILLLITIATEAHAQDVRCDSLSTPAAADSTVAAVAPYTSTTWIKQLINNGFHINDPGVQYPRFPRFLLKVYNWGDRVFNSYDPEYVVATGKNWKVLGKSYNWMQTYAFIFPHRDLLHINSNIYADMGGYLCFMAVSVGYMFNANELLAHNHDTRTNFNLNFTCALFTLDYTKKYVRGGATLRRFGGYDFSDVGHPTFNDLMNNSQSFTGLYFFNHRRYSHAAAYCFSKYQLRSAGSWIAGLGWRRQSIALDFSQLAPEVREALPEIADYYNFHYTDWLGLGGYGYNWALKPRTWLVNVTAALGLGYKHTYEDNTDGRRNLFATDGIVHVAAVYNHRALFVGMDLRADGMFYFNRSYTFFNSNVSLQATVGARF